jgi:signal transduction histidine kinase
MGIGIPPEHLSYLFEMFTQVRSALDRSQGGLAIGLSLVGGLIEMYGGRVEVRSEGPGRGSEFSVRPPAFAETPAPQSLQPESRNLSQPVTARHPRRGRH